MDMEAYSRTSACAGCGNTRLGTVEQRRTFEVGFEAPLVVRIEAAGCERCGRLAKPAAVNRAATLTALRQVATSGRVNGESFRFMRTTMGLQAKEVAHLLGLGVGTISRWENDVRDLDARAWVLLASLALEHAEGQSDSRTRGILDAVKAQPSVAALVSVRV